MPVCAKHSGWNTRNGLHNHFIDSLYQKWVGSPRTAMQAAHLRRMLCTKRCTLSCCSLSHSSTRNLLRSARVLLTFISGAPGPLSPTDPTRARWDLRLGSTPASQSLWYVVAVGMRPRSWRGGVGRCRLGAMRLAPWSGCRISSM